MKTFLEYVQEEELLETAISKNIIHDKSGTHLVPLQGALTHSLLNSHGYERETVFNRGDSQVHVYKGESGKKVIVNHDLNVNRHGHGVAWQVHHSNGESLGVGKGNDEGRARLSELL